MRFPALLISLVCLFSPCAQAGSWDHSTTILGRTHAGALAIAPTLGYGQMLWGERPGVLYGYIRPSVTPMLSPTQYAAKASLDIYPISFFGVTASRSNSRRFTTIDSQDCTNVICRGPLHSSEISFKLLLGFGSYVGSIQHSRTFYDEIRDDKPQIFDPGLAALLDADGEIVRQWTVLAGKKISEDQTAGLMHMSAQLSEGSQVQSSQYAFVRSRLNPYGFADWNVTLAAGRFESELNDLGISFVGILSYTGAASLALGN